MIISIMGARTEGILILPRNEKVSANSTSPIPVEGCKGF
jgi:hypothetical protein